MMIYSGSKIMIQCGSILVIWLAKGMPLPTPKRIKCCLAYSRFT